MLIMTYYFTSDWHLGHSNIIKYCRRPFMTSEESSLLDLAYKKIIPIKDFHISQESTDRMTSAILDNTNAVVKRDDVLVIAGDFCWLPRNKNENKINVIKSYINKLNCKNIFIICGNHDDRKILIASGCFKGVFEQYTFNVNGQKIFVSHYPCRSWESSFYGAWHAYGHVHNGLWKEDNGMLSTYQQIVYEEEFSKIIGKLAISEQEKKEVISKLLTSAALTNGIDYSIDVGVDNVVEGKLWGTPWAFDEIKCHFVAKQQKWEERKRVLSEIGF
ncbi:MAG: metallophosphoesterase [bacterium]